MVVSTSYFGSIPYFKAIANQERIALDSCNRYQKQTWRNRTALLSADGPLLLSVPVERPFGKNTMVKDVTISYATNWQKDHWRAIESCYRHAPYFFYYGEQVKDLIFQQSNKLLSFNTHILNQCLHWLDLPLIVEMTDLPVPFEVTQQHYNEIITAKTLNQVQQKYIQVFSDVLPFHPNLSILDLLMNEGPLARKYVL